MNKRTNSRQELADNGARPITDGGEDVSSEEETEENTSSTGRLGKFKDMIGIGSDHRQPSNAVQDEIESNSDVTTSQELSETLGDLDEVVEEYDVVRSDLEADVQATIQSYETEISENATQVASKLNAVLDVARSDLAHTYDFNPERGEHSLDFEGPGDDSATATDYGLDELEDTGLATFLAEGARAGDTAMNHFGELQNDMEDLADKRQEKQDELDNLRERNEDQLESSRSAFTTEEEQNRAETIKVAEDEADEETITQELNEINEELSRKRPRKEEHLEIGNNVLEEVRTAYDQHTSQAESAVREISEEVDYLTDALNQLTDVEIGSMEEMLEDAFANTDVDLGPVGKYLQDAEGDLKTAYREAVNDLTVQVARQYAQAEKAIEEIEVLEDGINRQTDRLEVDTSTEMQDILDDAYDGEDMEAYLEEQVKGVLDATYSARDEIRNTFRGLEELRDQDQLAE